MKDILLFSGGMDSFIAWHYLDKPTNVYFALGHRYERKELVAIINLNDRLDMGTIVDDRINLSDQEQEDAHIPMRNMLLASLAFYYGDKIWITIQKGEADLPDRSEKFFQRFSKLMRGLNGGKQVQVDSPFWHMTKAGMVKWYVEEGLSVEDLLETVSCYDPELYGPCGNCKACFRRWVALSCNDIEERYLTDPWKTDIAHAYLDRALAGHYDIQRNREIIVSMRKKGVTHNS